MREVLRKTASQCIEFLLRPVARMCLNHSIGFREFSQLSKTAFLTVAKEELEKHGIAPSASVLSVMTGLQRRDISEIEKDSPTAEISSQSSVCSKVIGQWQNDKRFLDRNKVPKLLLASGKQSEFVKLLRTVTTDPNHYAVLFELERIGAIERVGDKVRLITKAYTPRANTVQGYHLLSQDASSLIAAVEENLLGHDETPNLHASTTYDNIDPADIPHIKKWFIRLGKKMHTEVREFLSEYDRDLSPPKKNSAGKARVTFGSFSLSEDLSIKKEKKAR